MNDWWTPAKYTMYDNVTWLDIIRALWYMYELTTLIGRDGSMLLWHQVLVPHLQPWNTDKNCPFSTTTIHAPKSPSDNNSRLSQPYNALIIISSLSNVLSKPVEDPSVSTTVAWLRQSSPAQSGEQLNQPSHAAPAVSLTREGSSLRTRRSVVNLLHETNTGGAFGGGSAHHCLLWRPHPPSHMTGCWSAPLRNSTICLDQHLSTLVIDHEAWSEWI